MLRPPPKTLRLLLILCCKSLFVFVLILISLLPLPSIAKNTKISKTVCVEKNILLRGHFTLKIRPKKEECEKQEEEMLYERKSNGNLILFPLPKPTLEDPPPSSQF